MSTISSNFDSAETAISKLVHIDTQGFNNQQVSIGYSNLSAITTAQSVNNELLNRTGALVQMIAKQANKFPELAAKFEEFDRLEGNRLKNG